MIRLKWQEYQQCKIPILRATLLKSYCKINISKFQNCLLQPVTYDVYEKLFYCDYLVSQVYSRIFLFSSHQLKRCCSFCFMSKKVQFYQPTVHIFTRIEFEIYFWKIMSKWSKKTSLFNSSWTAKLVWLAY